MDKFIQYAFMCHRMPERSFHFNGKQFPLCARCTGIMVGYVLGLIILLTHGMLFLSLSIALIVPMIVDGTGQIFKKWESNNSRRFITGMMGGISIDFLIIHFTLIFVDLGRCFGENIFF